MLERIIPESIKYKVLSVFLFFFGVDTLFITLILLPDVANELFYKQATAYTDNPVYHITSKFSGGLDTYYYDIESRMKYQIDGKKVISDDTITVFNSFMTLSEEDAKEKAIETTASISQEPFTIIISTK